MNSEEMGCKQKKIFHESIVFLTKLKDGKQKGENMCVQKGYSFVFTLE